MRSLNYDQEPDGNVYLVGAGPGISSSSL